MKIPCEVIEDLLPLYVDEICSQESKKIVEEHLQTCEHCQKEYRKIKMPIGTENQNVHGERIAGEANILEKTEKDTAAKARSNKEFEINLEESKIIKRSFRKIKRRWFISLLVVALILPTCGLAFLGVNQYRGEGLCFTNLNEIYTVMKFIKCIKKGKYEQVVDMLEPHYVAEYKEIKQRQEDGPEQFVDGFGFLNEPQEPYLFDGNTWVFDPQYEEYHDYLYGEAEEFWKFVIQNQVAVMIPKESWNSVVGENYVTSEVEHLTLYYPFTENIDDFMIGAYQFIETEWGEYYVPYWGMDHSEQRAVDFCFDFVMYPYEIYLQGLEDMKQYIKQDYENFLTDFADELAMTQEEYVEYCRKQSMEALQKYRKQMNLVSFSFQDAFYSEYEKSWHIEIKVSESYSGKSNIYKSSLQLAIKDDVLICCGGSYSQELENIRDELLVSWLGKIF